MAQGRSQYTHGFNSCGLGPTHASAPLTPDPLQVTCPSPFGKVLANSTMKNFGVTLTFVSLFAWAFWVSLTQTLDDLTERDCKAGVVKACQELANGK